MVAGSRITANSICILRGSIIVPSSSPSEDVSSDAKTRMSANRPQFAGEDPDVIPVGFDFTDAGPFGQSCFLGDAVRHGFLVPDRDDRFRARAVLQLVHGA